MSARMCLKRADGTVYLDRWGWEWPKHDEGEVNRTRFGIFVHRMTAPDPGVDLHTHPWPFLSIILWGGYAEERNWVSLARVDANCAEAMEAISAHFDNPDHHEPRGRIVRRRWLSARTFDLDECHRIFVLRRKTSWSLVIHGRSRGYWTFLTPDGEVESHEYGQSERGRRRGLVNDLSADPSAP